MMSGLSNPTPDHIAFADESKFNTGRYRGIGLITLPTNERAGVAQELRHLLDESDIEEFSWKDLNGAKQRFAANKMIDCAVRHVLRGVMRVDVLTWDTHDGRHTLKGRDDIANLHRMYHHLLKHVLRERWPDESIWALHPDEHAAIDWKAVGDFLDRTSTRQKPAGDLFTPHGFAYAVTREFKISELTPLSSSTEPFVQLADLFVGLAVYSRTSFTHYERWRTESTGQLRLVEYDPKLAVRISGADKERCQVLAEVDRRCKAHSLGVSLRSNRGLRTLNPKNPVNFWWYQPQTEADKAPVKSR